MPSCAANQLIIIFATTGVIIEIIKGASQVGSRTLETVQRSGAIYSDRTRPNVLAVIQSVSACVSD